MPQCSAVVNAVGTLFASLCIWPKRGSTAALVTLCPWVSDTHPESFHSRFSSQRRAWPRVPHKHRPHLTRRPWLFATMSEMCLRNQSAAVSAERLLSRSPWPTSSAAPGGRECLLSWGTTAAPVSAADRRAHRAAGGTAWLLLCAPTAEPHRPLSGPHRNADCTSEIELALLGNRLRNGHSERTICLAIDFIHPSSNFTFSLPVSQRNP